MMLEALVYVSAANPEIDSQDVENILAAAERDNPSHELTGALIFTGSLFVQLLEGQSEKLDYMMNRIIADNRHSAVIALARGSIDHRQFPSWSMAYQMVEGLAADELHSQIGWDNTVKKLLDTIPQQHSIKSLTPIFVNVLGELKAQWASSQS